MAVTKDLIQNLKPGVDDTEDTVPKLAIHDYCDFLNVYKAGDITKTALKTKLSLATSDALHTAILVKLDADTVTVDQVTSRLRLYERGYFTSAEINTFFGV